MATSNPFSNLDSSNPFEISFYVTDIDLSIINSIRRVILSDIPNVGFFFDPNNFTDDKHINITINNTPLHNEFLQHRIALIPIHVSVSQLENWNDERYTFIIDKTNDTNSLLNVYSSDIQVYDNESKSFNKNLASTFFPPDVITKDHIIITKLNQQKGSKLHLEAKAIVGTPSKSTSFGIISNISIEFVVDEKTASKQLSKYIETNKDKDSIDNLTYQFNSIERERHYHRNKYREPNQFKIALTSESKLPCTYIFSNAIKILKDKILNFQQSNYEVINSDMLFSIIIENEGHTLGNLFQSLVFNNYIREGIDNEYKVTYIGYNIPHPLEKILLIKVKGDKLLVLDDVHGFVKKSCDFIYSQLSDLEIQWNTLSNN